MSLMSLTLYPAVSPITVNNKWRIGHQRNTQISRSSFIATSSTKLLVTRATSQINQTPNHATRATSAAVAVPTETSMSDMEKKREGGFWFRDWDRVDVTHLSLMIGKHVLAVFAPFVLNWGAFWVTVVLSFFTGMGVTLGYHRLLTHRSFKLPKWLEYFFAYCGVHAGQRDPIFWVSVHKNHHKYTDTEKDPHSPKEGFWFSHVGWFHYNDYLAAKGMRAVMVNHFTFFATSVCHIWGERPWKTPDTSTNNWWVALLTFGEGWHNNHHAFPSSACHGMEWWQLDLTWELIKFLEMVGLAKDVRLPTEAEKKRMSLLCSS
ncbi:hypothetical protein L1987_22822 [Smallanthus sonchifolius]|uniref:Uncharacterized protein n=1 Tax=Smallanthus sonchifolius TaxID=185202 RepID=A0ACB9IF75_9ASTR|nr:hypothetical protein L1987_22822 [Smallanthus sonchifolius]